MNSANLGVAVIRVGQRVTVQQRAVMVALYDNPFHTPALKVGTVGKIVLIEKAMSPAGSVEVTFETRADRWYRLEGKTREEIAEYFGL